MTLIKPQLTRDLTKPESFSHAVEIQRPYGELEPVLDWCKSILADEWRWQLVEMSSPRKPGRYIFYFNGEQDYMLFTLKHVG